MAVEEGAGAARRRGLSGRWGTASAVNQLLLCRLVKLLLISLCIEISGHTEINRQWPPMARFESNNIYPVD